MNVQNNLPTKKRLSEKVSSSFLGYVQYTFGGVFKIVPICPDEILSRFAVIYIYFLSIHHFVGRVVLLLAEIVWTVAKTAFYRPKKYILKRKDFVRRNCNCFPTFALSANHFWPFGWKISTELSKLNSTSLEERL